MINLTDRLSQESKYLTQDENGRIDQWKDLPTKDAALYWTNRESTYKEAVYFGEPNNNWEDSLIDLSKQIPYIKDGLLIGIPITKLTDEEFTGGSTNYYKVLINNPTTAEKPYIAECNDIIEALGMNYAEGNIFKAVWRRCAARKFDRKKKGYDDGTYDAEKIIFFGQRLLEMK